MFGKQTHAFGYQTRNYLQKVESVRKHCGLSVNSSNPSVCECVLTLMSLKKRNRSSLKSGKDTVSLAKGYLVLGNRLPEAIVPMAKHQQEVNMREVVARWYAIGAAIVTVAIWQGINAIPSLSGWFWGPAAGVLAVVLFILVPVVIERNRKAAA